MMIPAYQEIYLNSVQSALGDMFDFAINVCHITGDNFIKYFIASSVCRKIENGEPAYLVGKSGIEIANEIIEEATGKEVKQNSCDRFERSKEYWIGWAVAYYQWISCRSYKEIFRVASFENLDKMYFTLHEADISKFTEIMNSKMKKYFFDTNLKRIRTSYGFSQSELAKYSNVSLRSIQMYEQRNKDINKASVSTIYQLAKTLGCTMEDLIEK